MKHSSISSCDYLCSKFRVANSRMCPLFVRIKLNIDVQPNPNLWCCHPTWNMLCMKEQDIYFLYLVGQDRRKLLFQIITERAFPESLHDIFAFSYKPVRVDVYAELSYSFWFLQFNCVDSASNFSMLFHFICVISLPRQFDCCILTQTVNPNFKDGWGVFSIQEEHSRMAVPAKLWRIS